MSMPEGPNRTEIPAEVFAAGLPKNANAYKDPSEVANELHPDDAAAIQEREENLKKRNDRDAEIILYNLGLPDPNRTILPKK